MVLTCDYSGTIGGTGTLNPNTDCQLTDPLTWRKGLFVLTSPENFHGTSYSSIRGFAAEVGREQTLQETSVQGSLRGKPERKICTRCKVDQPASHFRASGTSRDGLQHFYIPCKVIEANSVGMAAPSTGVTAKAAVCGRCKQLKPGTYFNRSSSRKIGLQAWCKACDEEYKKQWREKVLELLPDRSANVEYKVCGRCHSAKPSKEFPRDNSTIDGLRHNCRQCKQKVKQLSYQRMPEASEPPDTQVCSFVAWRCQAATSILVQSLLRGCDLGARTVVRGTMHAGVVGTSRSAQAGGPTSLRIFSGIV
ncbi:g7826 [Coccomyxa elongata]